MGCSLCVRVMRWGAREAFTAPKTVAIARRVYPVPRLFRACDEDYSSHVHPNCSNNFFLLTCFLSIRSCRDPPALSLRVRPALDLTPGCCLAARPLAVGDLCVDGSVWVAWGTIVVMEAARGG